MSLAYGSRVGSASGATSVSSFSATTSGSIPAGSLIIVSVSCSNVGDLNNLSSVTDAAGNTYLSGAFTVDGGQNTLTAVWYCANCLALASSSLVTAHLSSALLTSGEAWRIAVDYATGAATSSVTDGSQGKNSQLLGTWNTGTGITTTNANDLLWVANGINQGEPAAVVAADCSPTTGWTIQTGIVNGGNNGDSLRTAYNIVAATGTYHGGGTCTSGSNGDSAVIVAFKAAAGGSTIALSGTISSSGAVKGTLGKSVPLTGTLSSAAAVSGTIKPTKPLAGTIASSGNVSGSLHRTTALAGTLASSAAVVGSLKKTAALHGLLSSASALSGTLTVSGSAIHLSGVCGSSSGLTAFLTVKRPLAGTISGAGGISGTLQVQGATIHLSGTISSVSACHGSLQVTHALTAIVAAVGGLKGTLVVTRHMAGVVPSSSALSGTFLVTPLFVVGKILLSDAALGVALLTDTAPLALLTDTAPIAILGDEYGQ